MDELERKVSFKRSVRTLLKLYTFFGLVNFTYNRVTNRVERSSHKECKLTFALSYCALSSLVCTFILVSAIAINYYSTASSAIIQSEEFLMSNRIVFKVFNTFILTVGYFAHRGSFVETINRILVLYERLKMLTEGDLCYPSSFQKFLTLRVVVFVVTGSVQTFSLSFLANVACFWWFLNSFALMEFTFWTHLYGNLTLMCFYQKMSNLLSVLCASTRKRTIKRRIREIISISYEIHSLKHKFNEVFNTLYVVCFFGMFGDISSLYKLLKLLVILVMDKMQVSTWEIVKLVFRITFSGCWASYNLYLNGHLAEGLVQSEKTFRRKLLTIFYTYDIVGRDPEQQREVRIRVRDDLQWVGLQIVSLQIELVLLHHTIQDLATRSFRLFVINHSFVFSFLKDIVVSYAILVLQQFTADYLTASGDRLDMLRKSVSKN